MRVKTSDEPHKEIDDLWAIHESRLKAVVTKQHDYDPAAYQFEMGYRKCLIDLMDRGVGRYILW